MRGTFSASVLVVAVLLAAACRGPVPKGAVLEFERLASLPSTADDYYNVFKHTPTATQLSRTRDALTRARSVGVRVLPVAASTGGVADIVLERITDRAGPKIITLLGHNENGVMRFADGSELNLNGLWMKAPSKLIVAISCESARYGSESQIGLLKAEAAQVGQLAEEIFVQKINELAQRGEEVTAARAQAELNAAVDSAAQVLQVESIVKGAAAPVGLAIGVRIYVESSAG